MKHNFKYILWSLVVLFFFVFPILVNYYTDWLWFLEVGFESIFLTSLFAKLIIVLVSGVFIFALLYLNVFLFKKLTNNEPIEIPVNKDGYIENLDISKIIEKFALPVSLLIAFLGGVLISSSWQTILLFFNKVEFNKLDPILGKDISYYIFSLPFYEILSGALFFILFISFIFTLFLYLAKGALVVKNTRKIGLVSMGSNLLMINKEAKIHIFILVAIIFLFFAFKIYFIQIPNLLLSNSGAFTGALYADVNAKLPVLYVLFYLSILFFFVVLFSIKKGGIKVVVSSFFVYTLVYFVGFSVYPNFLQSFVVKPNELKKETPYIKNHIKATQEAWGIANIKKKELSGDSSLTLEDIKNNSATIDNIRLWDRAPLRDTFGQLQEIRTYYDFVSVDNDRYEIDGKYRQVLLSPRELNSNSLPQKNFINERLSFTHGMGVALSPVNEKTEEGLPVLFVKDLPPKSEKEELKIDRPELYFGEISSDYVFVNTKAKEFNYPAGEENIYTSYNGDGGVKVSSFTRKAIFAYKFNSLKILLSNDITNESRVLYFRNIKDRVSKAFPFLVFDSDPYLVINEGRMIWLADAYTMSSKYPYSEVVNGKNYIRNSVKISIDAYDGKMKAYISDENDPIIKAYSSIFPNVFLSLKDVPISLKSHFRYPEDLFKDQANLYSIYHMQDPQVFYNKEDLWDMPKIKGSNRGENIGPLMRHLIMKLPGEDSEEFILMAPFTPRGKNNMAAWMAARSDGENYGQLIVYTFPKQSLVYGPKQIVNRINQDADISKQISLWDQRGSEVIQGNLSVIPINDSILYIRPLYLRAEGGKIPELKRVIVAYKNKISMQETLDLALIDIFGNIQVKDKNKVKNIGDKTSVNSIDALIKRANQHFKNAQSALKSVNWDLYGKEMKNLEEVLNLLNK